MNENYNIDIGPVIINEPSDRGTVQIKYQPFSNGDLIEILPFIVLVVKGKPLVVFEFTDAYVYHSVIKTEDERASFSTALRDMILEAYKQDSNIYTQKRYSSSRASLPEAPSEN